MIRDRLLQLALFTRFSEMPCHTPVFTAKFERQKKMLLCTHVVISLAFGMLIGFFVDENTSPRDQTQTTMTAKPNRTLESTNRTLESTTCKASINTTGQCWTPFGSFIKTITNPGSETERYLLRLLTTGWRSTCIEVIWQKDYSTLHSFSNITNPNLVVLLSQDGEEQHRSRYRLPEPEVYPPYCAFSRAGMAEAQLVYVNYGREEDFQLLVNNYSVSIAGKIVIARNSKISFRDKVKNAERHNVSGVILYSDPADYNINETYNTMRLHFLFLPGDAVRRDTLEIDGDLLTPFYPALDYAKRKSRKDLPMFKIPVQPISYDDAQIFLNELEGEEAPAGWKGHLPITYRIGEGQRNKQTVHLTVNNEESMKISGNLIGFLRGKEEPDRYVFIGSSHDTWVKSYVDSRLASEMMYRIQTEITDKYKAKRSKRSIAFCSWGGTKQGSIGSTEFVEEHLKLLQDRAVAYLTCACNYPYVLEVQTSPLLQDAVYEAAKKVANEDKDSPYKTLYDLWKHRARQNTSKGDQDPSVSYVLANNADLKPFYTRTGVPSASVWYTFDKSKWKIPHLPTYHSDYDGLYDEDTRSIEMFQLQCTKTLGKLMKELLWSLADDDILPINIRRYAEVLSTAIQGLKQDFGDLWKQHEIKIDALDSAVENLTSRAIVFHDELNNLTSIGALERRIINDKLMQFEKVFIDPEGLPGRRLYKHVVFSPSIHPGYSDKFFPGIVDTMVDIIKRGEDKWNILRQQIFIATFTIQSAANFLNDANF